MCVKLYKTIPVRGFAYVTVITLDAPLSRVFLPIYEDYKSQWLVLRF